ncbi:MAG TPA: amidohydrolase family protein [Candidatus Nanoarchaeia archaeon]|nr:amidohydrolase family protein [Candidatus Nanoarchaeia archaeon]
MNDIHAHAGGKCFGVSGLYDSSISDYFSRNKSVDKAVFFAQPLPYEFLGFYRRDYPPIDFSAKNDEIGDECIDYDRAFFGVFVDVRDYHAKTEVARCVKLYDPKLVKVHFEINHVNPRVLNDYGLIGVLRDFNLPVLLHPFRELTSELSNVFLTSQDVNFIVAHLGFLRKDFLDAVSVCDNVYLDTSGITHPNFSKLCLQGLSVDLNNKLISKDEYNILRLIVDSPCKVINYVSHKVGFKKLVFGSDEAWSDLASQYRIISSCGINECDKSDIFVNNFNKLIK